MTGLNAREQLEAAESWLAQANEDISYGLRTAEDALKLWRYAETREEDTYPDEWEDSELVAVLGYSPWKGTYEDGKKVAD